MTIKGYSSRGYDLAMQRIYSDFYNNRYWPCIRGEDVMRMNFRILREGKLELDKKFSAKNDEEKEELLLIERTNSQGTPSVLIPGFIIGEERILSEEVNREVPLIKFDPASDYERGILQRIIRRNKSKINLLRGEGEFQLKGDFVFTNDSPDIKGACHTPLRIVWE